MPSVPRQKRKKPRPKLLRPKLARRPLPEHLPRERIVYPGPSSCPCCGGALHKLGEDVTETLELIPRQWKVIQHVREKFSCRSCETITQPPAPSHPISRGRAGPVLLAHLLFAKYGLHLPLDRQSNVYAREGIDLDVSTLADWVGACAATLMPLAETIRGHVFAAERIHADDTTVPVLAKGKTRTGRLWTYVRDDGPFGGSDPPAGSINVQLARRLHALRYDYVTLPTPWWDVDERNPGRWLSEKFGFLEIKFEYPVGGTPHRAWLFDCHNSTYHDDPIRFEIISEKIDNLSNGQPCKLYIEKSKLQE